MMTPPLMSRFDSIVEEDKRTYIDAVHIAEKTGLPEFHVHQQMIKFGMPPAAYMVDLTKVWGHKKVYLNSQLDDLMKKLMRIVKYDERRKLLEKLEARLSHEKH